jgi:hypothetical protein
MMKVSRKTELKIIPSIFLPIFLLANICFGAETDIAKTYEISKQNGWSNICQIDVVDQTAFSHVSFYIRPLQNNIADQYQGDDRDEWPLEIMTDSYFAFRICHPSPELKKQLQNKIAQFEQGHKATKRAENIDNTLAQFLLCDDIFEECSTKIDTDIAYKIYIYQLDNQSVFNEIKNIFSTDLSIDKIIKKGLEIIHDRYHQ